MWKIAVQILLFFLPWGARRRFLDLLFGYDIAATARIGFSILLPARLKLGENSRIGHLNYCRNLSLLDIGEGGSVGNLNWISGTVASHPRHFVADVGRFPALIIEEHASIAHRHLLDCTDTIRVGAFTTVAGWRSQLITHGIDIAEGSNRAAPLLIGRYCLIGTGVICLKGSSLPDYSILSAGSVLNRKFSETHALYSGCPAVKVRELPDQARYFTRTTGPV